MRSASGLWLACGPVKGLGVYNRLFLHTALSLRPAHLWFTGTFSPKSPQQKRTLLHTFFMQFFSVSLCLSPVSTGPITSTIPLKKELISRRAA